MNEDVEVCGRVHAESVNTMLAAGRSYADIIRSLQDQGHHGFNKVNLHNWKTTGYQAWLRCKASNPPT